MNDQEIRPNKLIIDHVKKQIEYFICFCIGSSADFSYSIQLLGAFNRQKAIERGGVLNLAAYGSLTFCYTNLL